MDYGFTTVKQNNRTFAFGDESLNFVPLFLEVGEHPLIGIDSGLDEVNFGVESCEYPLMIVDIESAGSEKVLKVWVNWLRRWKDDTNEQSIATRDWFAPFEFVSPVERL
jgi:hypothetical protein